MGTSFRPDKEGTHRRQFEVNKRKILATQNVCGICGRPVDMSFRYPHPLSPTIDHIIPVAKGGHPSAMENLQLAHRCCNRSKSDKLIESRLVTDQTQRVSNRLLPLTVDWKTV